VPSNKICGNENFWILPQQFDVCSTTEGDHQTLGIATHSNCCYCYCCSVTAATANGIVVQQHIGNNNFFNRSWDEFKVGFGNSSDNYWIGNERLHQLTKDGQYKLRVDLLAKFNGLWYWAEHDRFSVGSEQTGYTLIVSGYSHSGNAGDAMTVDGLTDYNLNGLKFTTYDRFDVNAYRNCAIDRNYIGGFWYPTDPFCGYALVNQNAYFQWKALPIGRRSANHLALLISRMTLLKK